jgi:hypothetical protein
LFRYKAPAILIWLARRSSGIVLAFTGSVHFIIFLAPLFFVSVAFVIDNELKLSYAPFIKKYTHPYPSRFISNCGIEIGT